MVACDGGTVRTLTRPWRCAVASTALAVAVACWAQPLRAQAHASKRADARPAYVVQPDVCLTLEVDIAGDVPGIEPNEAPTKMGLGPSITTYDSSMIPNQELLEFVLGAADKAKIPYQLSQIARGGTDAGIIHISNAGCPSLVIGVPTRHIHAHAGMLSLSDAENAVKLLVEVVKRLDRKKADSFTSL